MSKPIARPEATEALQQVIEAGAKRVEAVRYALLQTSSNHAKKPQD